MSIIPNNVKVNRNISSKLRLLIYGESYVGKTTLANTFPNPLFISTDGNVNGIDAPAILLKPTMDKLTTSGTTLKMNGWKYLNDVIAELKTDTQYETIVVDLLKDIEQFCTDSILSEYGAKELKDVGAYSVGWTLQKQAFVKFIRNLCTLDKNIILIDAGKHRVDMNGNSKGYTPYIREKLYKEVMSYIDGTFLIDYYKDVAGNELVNEHNQKIRVIHVGGSTTALSGNRLNLNTNEPLLASYDEIIKAITATQQTTGEK